MRIAFRRYGALAFFLGLPCTPAWADVAEGEPVAAIPAGLLTPSRVFAAAMPDGWSLSEPALASGNGEASIPFATVYGPDEGHAVSSSPDAPPLDRSGHVPREFASHRGFVRQAGSIGTEVAILSAYVGAQSVPKLFRPTAPFHFKNEGWFGKDTDNVGVDKLTHAFNTYLIAEILHYRLHRSTGASEGDALTAGILAAGIMALNELSDGIEPDSGYSMQDITMNVTGAAFSVLRNTVPGLKEKLAFKVEIVPNDQIYSRVGKEHYAQQRYMLSLKGAGFDALDGTAFKYLDLQVGYYATDFLNNDRAAGIVPKRHVFVGVGLNLGELMFGRSRSRIGRAAYSVLDYIQIPYTSLRYDSTGRLGE
ncbi:MAG TPA: DUF2279 domain-containing protein [Novosphingobium sp.]|nr:DUF2279 domain-containing protein [Novosphingobium sp.]